MASDKQEIQAIFSEAIELVSDEDRRRYLDQACGDDLQMRARAEALLHAHSEAGGFFGGKSSAADATKIFSITEHPGTIIGAYKLLQQIGEGGMGVVFMAEQTEPIQRTVALKIIKPGMDTRQVIARFEAERQAVAMMDHPNIAKVLDAGTTESGRPYFVMELVKGVPITKYCDEKHLPIRARLELFVQVCQAVQHAHQKGIIHRDIKPNNVLVAEYDNHAVPKVIDFGVAKATAQKLTERTMFTEFGQVLGTMEYMSPEQSKFNQLDIDTRSDIYSLGIMLYELLAGSTPFGGKRLHEAAFDEMLRIIREEEPPKPSTRLTASDTLPSIAANRHIDPARLSKDVQGELDWIVMKALEKDRNRRYETASGFAADIERHLHDEPVEAGPPSATYRFRKFAKRNRTTVAVGAVLAMSLLVALGGIASGIGWAVRDRAAREEQLAHERTARQAKVSGQLELILDEVMRLEQAEKWSEALVAARRAEPAIAEGEASPDIQERARQALADLELVRRIEEIRAHSGTAWGSWRDPKRDPTLNALAVQAEQDYAAAFRGAGIDVDTLSVEETAKRITARGAIAAAVLPALDDWVAVRNKVKDESATRRLIDVLRTADPDPWRQRIRDCLARKDWAALERLVSSPDLDRQPAATISFLSAALRRQAAADTERADGVGGELGHRGFFLEIDVLRRAQLNYPADYWINRRLGVSLIWLHSPPLIVQEGIGYLRAAVAVRPQEAEAMMNMSLGYEFLGEYDQALACYRKALESAPQDASLHNSLAWLFATSENAQLRDPGRAVHLAKRAVDLESHDGNSWNTLGVAQYRAGEWQAAIDALGKSMELRGGGDAWDWLFLAMAHWQLGNKDEARKWYDQGVQWMQKNKPKDEELRRFREEAANLLKITDQKPTTKPKTK
jgi:serine/threonine protein kinase